MSDTIVKDPAWETEVIMQDGTLEKLFHLRENGTTVKTEIMAGITTFMTMAYILAVNPSILSVTGMDKGALLTVTALASCFATLLMAADAADGSFRQLSLCVICGHGVECLFCFYSSKTDGVFLGDGPGCRLRGRSHLYCPVSD